MTSSVWSGIGFVFHRQVACRATPLVRDYGALEEPLFEQQEVIGLAGLSMVKHLS